MDRLLIRARAWATKHGLFGPQAFLRYVMFTYLGALNEVSKEFIFKGGNLLWVYIGTPRATVDLDLATESIESHAEVERVLKRACELPKDIRFFVEDFEKIDEDSKKGASVRIHYRTAEGAENSFSIDIVYALPTDQNEIPSPLGEKGKVHAATPENIVSDKLGALQRFGAGNTRIKDLDDLWRLAGTEILKPKRLAQILKGRGITAQVDLEWINPDMERAWGRHCKRYPDLPSSLDQVFNEINLRLSAILARVR